MAGPEHFRAGNQLQLEVSDNGCGMSVETQARAFDPFFTTKLGGHGLGLAMVQGSVRGLDGSIDVRSEPGRGTSFVITLPCAPVQGLCTDHALSEQDDLTPVRRDYTLLVVEDEEFLRTALVKLLRKRGFEDRLLGRDRRGVVGDRLRRRQRRTRRRGRRCDARARRPRHQRR